MKYDIITLGGAVVDIFVDTGISQTNQKLCIPMGSKLLIENATFGTGGGGTNTAASFASLGLKTGFIGKLGKDEFAEKILTDLKKRKIEFLGKKSEEPTGIAIILDSNQHNRTILINKGANNTLKFSELDLKKIKTNWIYLSSAIEQTLQTQIKLAEWARKKGIKIAYNPSAYLTKKGAKKIKSLLKNVNAIILNEEEAKDLAQGNLFKKIHALGPEYVCITLGKKGNKVSHNNKIFTSIPRKIKIKERTGAGDAFASGFIAGLIKFDDPKKAIQLGTLNAESVIQIKGAKNGILKEKQISEINKIKII